MRALKRRLTALGEASAEPAIAGRLIELAGTDRGAPAGALAVPAPSGPAHRGRAGEWGPRLITRSWRMATASAGGALIAIRPLAFLLGDRGPAPAAPTVPPSGR